MKDYEVKTICNEANMFRKNSKYVWKSFKYSVHKKKTANNDSLSIVLIAFIEADGLPK